MANRLYDETAISNIANAIRTKNGTQNTYTVAQMADAIIAIPSGGGGITPTGTISITNNGTYDVTTYASASVSVSGGGGFLPSNIVTGSITFTSQPEVSTGVDFAHGLSGTPTLFYIGLGDVSDISANTNLSAMNIVNYQIVTNASKVIQSKTNIFTVAIDSTNITLTRVNNTYNFALNQPYYWMAIL